MAATILFYSQKHFLGLIAAEETISGKLLLATLNALHYNDVLVFMRTVDSLAEVCPSTLINTFVPATEAVLVDSAGDWGFRQQDYPFPGAIHG